MALTSFLRSWRRRWATSDRFAVLRFYAFYLRWPLLLALLALLGEKLIFYGLLPMQNRIEREWSYFRAGRAFAAGRDQQALFSVREALLDDRGDARVWRRAAVISDRLDSPEAPYCWEQADLLAPGSTATELALAQSAVRHGEWDLAGAALREVPPAQQDGVDFLLASGQVAIAEGQPALSFLERVEDLHPSASATLFALADAYAGMGNRADAGRARAILTGLAGRGPERLQALRKLLALDLQMGDRAAARQAEADLLATPGATFDDRRRELDVAMDAETEPIVQRLLASASRADVPAVIDWMATHGRAEEALIWVRRQDEAWQDDAHIGQARAACLRALGEWTHLRDDQRDSNWPGHEPARLLLLAEASWHLGQTGDAESAWHRAVAAAATPDDFTELTEAALRAPAPEADDFQTEVWIGMANRFPGQQWPLRRLLRESLASGQLPMARQAADRLCPLAPGDAVLAATRDLIVLRQGAASTATTSDLARLEAASPGDPTVATAAAYALYLDGHFDEALATLGVLPPADLRDPVRAAYVGQLLAAAGPVDQAEAALRTAQKQAALPETEKAAVARALALVAYRRAMTGLLQTSSAADWRQAHDFFLEQAPSGEAVFVIGAAVALLPDRDQAADMLTRVDPSGLDAVTLELEEGAVRALAGPVSRGLPRLQLANGLPVETPLARWTQIVGAWWELNDRTGFDPAVMAGLLNAYRGLENAGPREDFWQRDEAREVRLAREMLASGTRAEAVQARLEALLRHVPPTPEIEAEIGYALFLQGRVEAGRQRLEVLSETDRQRPEPARYYAAILRACGETKQATRYELLATRETGAGKPL